jgi:glucose/arabinose dehydrogenase
MRSRSTVASSGLRPRARRALAGAALAGCGAAILATASGRASAERRVIAAQADSVRLVRVGRFSRPTYVVSPPGDTRRQLVVEQRGVVRIVRDGSRLARPFLDLRRRVGCCGEAGLLSLAFAPDYARSRRFYVYYTTRSGSIAVDELRRSLRDPERAVAGSRRRVLRQRHRTANHKGGQLRFGADGMLYLGLGDGGPQGDPHRRGQDLGTLLGKILRIDPRARRGYRVPRSNPFVRRVGARPEIWAYGVRNPWRFAFTRRGALLLGDVGQNAVEELDYLPGRRGGQPRGGVNFGWSVFEGSRRFRPGDAPGHVPPVLERRHGPGGPCGIIGGFPVRDRSLATLRGRYVYGDFCEPGLRTVAIRRGRAVGDRAVGVRVSAMSSFGEDAQGRVYVMSVTGPVWRLAPTR